MTLALRLLPVCEKEKKIFPDIRRKANDGVGGCVCWWYTLGDSRRRMAEVYGLSPAAPRRESIYTGVCQKEKGGQDEFNHYFNTRSSNHLLSIYLD